MPNVNTPSKTYLELEKKRKLPRVLAEGIFKLQEEETAQWALPRNPTEIPITMPAPIGRIDPWWNRVKMSRLKNMFMEAVGDCVGRAFAKPAKFDATSPKELLEFADDVDGRGTNFHVFAMAQSGASTTEGVDFVLVDYPSDDPTGLTLADWEMRRQAPFWRRYPCSSVIGWTHAKFGKTERLVRVRLRETAVVPDGAWGDTEVQQVRVLYAGDPLAPEGNEARYTRWEVYRPDKADALEGDWSLVASGSMRPQVDIPLVEFPFLLAQSFAATPPFLDLAYLTLAHYRKLSDLDNAQHAVGYPIMHWAGGQIDAETGMPVGLGPNRMLVSADAQAKVEFVEPAGSSWASLRAELTAMEDNGRDLAAQPQNMQTAGQLTATGEAIRAARSSSQLEAAVLSWEDSYNRLLNYTAIYMTDLSADATSGWGKVKLNRRFVPVTRNIEGVQTAIQLHEIGRLSDETLHEVAQGAEVTPDGIDFEMEQERIAASGPTMAEIDRREALKLVEANASGGDKKDGEKPPAKEQVPPDDEAQ